MNEKMCGCSNNPELPTEPNRQVIEKILEKHNDKPDALLQVLLEINEMNGHIPEEAVYQIAEGLGIKPSEIFGMITYYQALRLEPWGKYIIHICLGTTCHLRGSSALLERVCNELNLEPGGTTPDGKFSLEVVRCLGACALSPVIMINNVIYPQVDLDSIPGILQSCE